MKRKWSSIHVAALFLGFFIVSGCRQLGTSANDTPTPVTTPTPNPTVDPKPSNTPPPTGSTTTNPSPTPTPPAGPTPVPTALAKLLGIKNAVDLREFDSPVEDQFGGTCSDFATAAVMDNVLKQKGITDTVSEEDLWTLYGVYDADAAVLAASSHQVLESDYWPTNGVRQNNPQKFDSFQITKSNFLNYDMNGALKALNQNHPVVMAIQVPESMANCDTMVDPNSKKTTGEHVMAAVGYKLDDSISGGGYFVLKNSWGTDCGDRGYLYYPLSLCKRKDLYCYFIEVDDVVEKEATALTSF